MDKFERRPTKKDERQILREMGEFVECMEQLERTHIWDEQGKELVPRINEPTK